MASVLATHHIPPVTGVSRVVGRQYIALVLSASGLGSAPQCERLLAAGRVALRGRPVRSPRTRVDPFRDTFTVDGVPVPPPRTCRYLAFHKPYQVLSSFTDREGRQTLADYVGLADVYAVGRLDYDSEELMLLTDDGWLNHRLTHPQCAHTKEYLVQVERVPDDAALAALGAGVVIKGQRTRPAQVSLLVGEGEPEMPPRSVPIRYRKNVPTAWLRIALTEGRKRQIRHMTAAVGHPTLRLIRAAIGPITLGDLAPGAWRELDEGELHALSAALHQPPRPSEPRSARR